MLPPAPQAQSRSIKAQNIKHLSLQSVKSREWVVGTPRRNKLRGVPTLDSRKKTSIATQRDRRIDSPRPPSRSESGQQSNHEQQCRRSRQRNRVGASHSIQLCL